MSECNSIENTDSAYYQQNQDVVLSKAKDYYKNNKDRLREQARNKYRNLSEEEKNKTKKQRLKEYQKIYCEAKKSQYNNK